MTLIEVQEWKLSSCLMPGWCQGRLLDTPPDDSKKTIRLCRACIKKGHDSVMREFRQRFTEVMPKDWKILLNDSEMPNSFTLRGRKYVKVEDE